MIARIYTSDYKSEQLTIPSVNKRLSRNNKNINRILMPLDQNIPKNIAKNMNQESSKETLSKNTKRKPGRPRKCPSSKENAENENNSTNMGHESKDDPLSENSKRKRGRPRKGPFMTEIIENRNNATTTNIMDQESIESPLPMDSQRKPGRPRNSSSQTNQKMSKKIDQESKEDPLSKNTKRNRGRPRKGPSTEVTEDSLKCILPNRQTGVSQSKMTEKTLNIKLSDIKRPLTPSRTLNVTLFDTVGTSRSRSKSADPGTLHKSYSAKDVLNKNQTNHQIFVRSLKIVLEDIQAKVVQGQRRRSKSLCLYKSTKHAETVESLPSFGNSKTLKVVLEDIQGTRNMLRRRSKNLCVRQVNNADVISETKLKNNGIATSKEATCKPKTAEHKILIKKQNAGKCSNSNQRPTKRSVADSSTLHSSNDGINKNQRNHSNFERSLKIVLEDILAKVPQVQRRRSKSLCLDRGTNHAVESLSSFEKFKTLKVVLKDIKGTQNILRRRSKSLCSKQVHNADAIISETKLTNNEQLTSKEALSKPKTLPKTTEYKILIKKRNADKCDKNQQAKERSVTEHSLNCILPDKHTRKVIPLKITKKTCQYVANRARPRSKTVELTKASDMLQKPLFTSTPKKVSVVTPISPSFNIRSRTHLKPSHWLNETLLDTAILNKSRSRSANSSTLHSSNNGINKNQRNHQNFERCLKIVLEDIQAKVVPGERRRSKSLCLDKGTKNAVESLSSFGKLKTLKVVLEDIQGTKNILRRRSKSLCAKQVNNADAIISETNLENKRQVGTLKKALKSKPKTAESKILIITQSADKGQSKLEKRETNKKGQTSSNNQETIEKGKQRIIQINALKIHTLQQKEVTFKLTAAPPSKLRKLEPIRYLEGSDAESSFDDPVLNLSLKTKDSMPVYRKAFPESPKTDKSVSDLYEFTDLSPKKTKLEKHKKLRKSSICFDKNTHEIMKKIGLKEAKAGKRALKKALKPHTKNYKTLVSGILKNVVKNINRKIQVKAIIHEEKLQQVNNVHELPVYDNELGHPMCPIIQSPPGLPSRDHSPEPPISRIEPTSSHVTTRKVQPTPLSTITPKKSDNIRQSTTSINENELEHDMDLIVQSPPGLPSRDHSPEPSITSPLHKHIYISNVIIRKPLPTPLSTMPCEESHNVSQSTGIPLTLTDNITTKRGIDRPPEHVVLHSIHSSDNTLSQQDIESCFGFEEDQASPNSRCVNNLININEKRGGAGIDSPANFHVRRPNANSTMCQKTSSPWRSNLNVRQNPHFVSIKNNALPRITQDMVLDYRLVEEFGSSSKIQHNDTPGKNSPVQTSILDFVEGNVRQKDNMLMHRSLYDVEEFDSPDKTNRRMNRRANKVRRNLEESITDVSKNSPQKRTPLMPLNESEQGPHLSNISTNVVEPVNYFGFEESTGLIEDKENQNENSPGKPSRFDLTTLKRYRKKQKRAEQKLLKENEIVTVPEVLNATQNDESISLMEGLSQDANDEPHIFEDPEEMLDKMAMEVPEKKSKRMRRDSDTSETGKKKRKHKKTKFELEQEAWINNFNEICDDIDKEQLEVE